MDGPLENDTISYDYDNKGRVVKLMVEGSQDVEYLYDELDRLIKIKQAGAEYLYTYKSNSNLVASLTRPNSTRTDYDYDNLNRLSLVLHSANNGVLLSKYRMQYNEHDAFSAVDSLKDAEILTSKNKGKE